MNKTIHESASFLLKPIGTIKTNEEEKKFWVEIQKEYRLALQELDHYSHVHVIWWAHKHTNENSRKILRIEQLPPFYGEDAPPMGVFATRAEYRPNPIAITTCPILDLNLTEGKIVLPWCDAFDGTPVLDLKPYIKMSDRIETASYPSYLQHWPDSQETAAKWWANQQP